MTGDKREDALGERPTAFRLYQGGQIVALVVCPDPDRARREIDHYAAVYGQDEPVRIVARRPNGRWPQQSLTKQETDR